MVTVVGVAEVHDRGQQLDTYGVGKGQRDVQTQQVLTFDVDGQMVQLKSRDLFPIKDGDIVAASGSKKGGVLRARGAYNQTRDVIGKNYWSVIGGRPLQAWIVSIILAALIIFIPAAILVLVIWWLDSSGANSAVSSAKSAAKKYAKGQDKT